MVSVSTSAHSFPDQQITGWNGIMSAADLTLKLLVAFVSITHIMMLTKLFLWESAVISHSRGHFGIQAKPVNW